MKPPYKVIWTDEALKNVDSIITWLENNWNEREVYHFLEKLEKRETLLSAILCASLCVPLRLKKPSDYSIPGTGHEIPVYKHLMPVQPPVL
jgi:hypothetical protein